MFVVSEGHELAEIEDGGSCRVRSAASNRIEVTQAFESGMTLKATEQWCAEVPMKGFADDAVPWVAVRPPGSSGPISVWRTPEMISEQVGDADCPQRLEAGSKS